MASIPATQRVLRALPKRPGCYMGYQDGEDGPDEAGDVDPARASVSCNPPGRFGVSRVGVHV